MWDDLTARLEGEVVVLEPLAARHEQELFEAAQHPEIWTWLAPIGDNRDYFSAWLSASLAEAAAGREGVFATLDRTSGRAVGSTRYMNLREPHRGLEIGWTWLTPAMWRTGANIEAKLLMLGHAFERLECIRVAQFEGILRKHMLMPGVGVRDSAYYSVIDDDWSAVRANLERRLAIARSRSAEPERPASQQ